MNKHNTDDLKMMQDNDIEYLLKSVKRDIYRLEKNLRRSYSKHSQSELSLMQIEYCYIKREHDTRIIRQQKHMEYLKSIQRRPYRRMNGV